MTDNALITQQTSIDFVRNLIKTVDALRNEVFEKDVDFGVIPGTGDKPTLLLPGMEKLMRVLNVVPDYPERRVIVDYDKMLFHYEYECILINVDTGVIIPGGRGLGLCTSRESTFRWRQGQRVCPNCGREAIIKGKVEYGGGWLCFKKKDGCGTNFKIDDPAITQQVVGRIENPDIADQINAIMKRAKKRALGDAVKGAACISKFFTVDLEDTVQTHDDVIEAEIVDDTPPEAPAHWTVNEAAMKQFDAKVQETYGVSRLEVEDLLGRTYAEFETRAECGASVKDAMEKKLASDKPATPKAKAPAAKKPAEPKKDESWYKKDPRTIAIWTRTHFGREPSEVLHDIKAKSWDDFKDIFAACARVKEVASAELWDVRAEKATYTEGDHSIRFKTPIGDLTTWSRKALVEAVQFAGQDNWKDVPKWEEGQHTLPDPVWLILEAKDDQIVIKEIRNASIAF